jgi:hypothetical protein
VRDGTTGPGQHAGFLGRAPIEEVDPCPRGDLYHEPLGFGRLFRVRHREEIQVQRRLGGIDHGRPRIGAACRNAAAATSHLRP